MASCTVSSSSSVCSNASISMNEVRGCYATSEGLAVDPYAFTTEGEPARVSIGTPSFVPSPTPSTFSFNSNTTPLHERSSPLDGLPPMASSHQNAVASQPKETVCVTVRFRPLSLREVQQGDEVAWYADGNTVVRNEYNPITAYAFDKVFVPTTTTRGVYDVAAMNVVRGAMEGINGTVFAYGVTSSGKTYTMHGDPKSPGIIPLAVKDVFSIIQETPEREYLLRVSYLEIYNEVINDLLNPDGQNLRIREDAEGTYVEGITEEVVLSPVHALSLITAGEELRHVGSNNYNLLSSRSHTVFTLTIESSPRLMDPYEEVEEVTISQLTLIDLAGSESSKTETTGQRRKEGSYINKSLLTLGTVIGKLSEGRASHVPYRDSKLTRLLQSSLCGNGRVSLICTLTPASSNMEETHNTLKFAHRAKRLTVQAIANRVFDERLLIKKYQTEILSLRTELDQLKREIYVRSSTHPEDSTFLCQQLKARQVRLILRLEEEERAKAALLGRIQRLTKLILVSFKNNTKSQVPHVQHKRSHSFGEEKGLFALSDWNLCTSVKRGHVAKSHVGGDEECRQQQSLSDLLQIKNLMSGQMELFRGQLKVLSSQVGTCQRSFKLLEEHSLSNPEDTLLQVEKVTMKTVLSDKEVEMQVLEQKIRENIFGALKNMSPLQISEAVPSLICQLNKKEWEMETKDAEIVVLEEQLRAQVSEIKKLQTMGKYRQKDMLLECLTPQRELNDQLPRACLKRNATLNATESQRGFSNSTFFDGDSRDKGSEADFSDSGSYSSKGSSHIVSHSSTMHGQMLMKAAEIESLKHEMLRLQEENESLQIKTRKLLEEASYAKGLASAAAVELRNLAQEVTKLSFQNSKLASELSLLQRDGFSRRFGNISVADGLSTNRSDSRDALIRKESHLKAPFREKDNDNEVCDIDTWKLDPDDLKRELYARQERERSLEAALVDKEKTETVLRKKLEEGKKRESDLENDLAGMWVQLALLRKERGIIESFDGNFSSTETCGSAIRKEDQLNSVPKASPERDPLSAEELQNHLEEQKNRTLELQTLVSQLKSDELEGLQLHVLEELQKVHVEALTKLFQAKAKFQEQVSMNGKGQQDDEKNSHVCKICFEAPTAAVLLPCRHFCLCKPCAVACTECPLCRCRIADRIITFTS